MRNEAVAETVDEETSSDTGPTRSDSTAWNESVSAGRANVPRPPSYASDDGVSYVVEAQPRSIAPLVDVPLRECVHPAERRPSAWL